MSVFNPNDQRCLDATTKLRCLTCLSLDRDLKPLKEKNILALLCPELFATPTFTSAVQMICWECKAMILKIKEFISRVTKAQDILKISSEKGYYFCEDLSTLKTTTVETVYISSQPSSPLPKVIYKQIEKIEPISEEDELLSEEDEPLYKEESLSIENELLYKEELLSIEDEPLSKEQSIEDEPLYKEKSLYKEDEPLYKEESLSIEDEPLYKENSLSKEDEPLYKEEPLSEEDEPLYKEEPLSEDEPLYKEEPLSEEYEPLSEEDEPFSIVEVEEKKYDLSGDNDELVQPMTIQQTGSDPIITVQDKPIPQKKSVESDMKTMDTPTLNYKPQNDFKNILIPQITGLRESKEMVKVTDGVTNLLKRSKSIPTILKRQKSAPTTVKGTRSAPTTVKGTKSPPTTVKSTKSAPTTVKCKESILTMVQRYVAVPDAIKDQFNATTIQKSNEVQLRISDRLRLDCKEIKCRTMTRAEMQKYMDSKRNDPIFKRTQYKCIKCIERFSNKVKLDIHNKKHDVSSGNFVCDICDQRFVLKDELDEHYKPHFSNKNQRWKLVQKTHKCATCGKRFGFKNNLTRHEQLHRVPSLLEECTTCHKMIRVDRIKVHAQIHSDRQRFSCVQCAKSFVSRATYEHHIKYTQPHAQTDVLKYKCTMCDKGYRSRNQLSDHVDYQHMGKTQHKCPICGKALASRRCIARHVRRTHDGESARDKICQQCGKAFKEKTALREHQRLHTGERPFSCEICGCKFRLSGSLCMHRRRVHHLHPSTKRVKLQEQNS